MDKCSEDAMKKFARQDTIRNSLQDGLTDNRGKTTNEAVEALALSGALSSTASSLLYFVVFVVWCRR